MKSPDLPESTGPNDPEAPWNQPADEWEPEFTCIVCGRSLEQDDVIWEGDNSFCLPCAVEDEKE